MKFKTLIVLGALILTVFSPLQINLRANPDGKIASLFMLDVCHASGSALSPQVDMPYAAGCPISLRLFEITANYVELNLDLKPFLSAFQQERPPKA